MTRTLPPLRLTGAQVLLDGALHPGDIALANGRIVQDADHDVDLTGYLVLPGIVDINGDAMEHHLAPRSRAPFPMGLALGSIDRALTAHGVTTAWLTAHWSWEGGLHSPEQVETTLAALNDYKPHALADLRLQIRCETHMPDTRQRLIDTVRRHGVDYVVHNNHLPKAMQMVNLAPHRLANWAERDGGQLEEFIARARAARDVASQVPRHLGALAAAFDAQGVIHGSHGDPDGETRDLYHALGAHICQCPTSSAAVSVGRVWGDRVALGAPGVLLDQRHSGRLSARLLIARGMCDILVSEFHYPALPAAAWALADDAVIPFARAWDMISTNPAQVMNLTDRGRLAPGNRADLVIMNAETRAIEATICAGRPTYLAGEVASRLLSAAAPSRRLAAE